MTNINDPFTRRQEKLSVLLEESGFDALVLNPGSSLTYLTGVHFHLMERPIFAIFRIDSAPIIIFPELESQKLVGISYPVEQFSYGEDPTTWPGIFRQALQELDGARLGVENNQMRLLEFRLLEKALPRSTFSHAGETVAKLRMYKDQSEIESMQTAVEIAEQALIAALSMAKIGMTEKELANELVMQLLRHGSEAELPFPPIVSTGPNGANPHASPSDRQLAAGDLLVIDYGASYNGYISDITRTFGVAEVTPEQEKIHQIVQQANAAGRQTGRPGIPCGAIDEAARQVIEQAGYGELFTHRTGHGIGLEPHEDPYIRAGNSMLLEPGMTFTIEPGIYLPQRFGVRIEDNVVITADGLRSLSTLPRELKIIAA